MLLPLPLPALRWTSQSNFNALSYQDPKLQGRMILEALQIIRQYLVVKVHRDANCQMISTKICRMDNKITGQYKEMALWT